MRRSLLPVLPALLVLAAAALPSAALAGEADLVPLLRGDLSVTVIDARDEAMRGDQRLHWTADGDGYRAAAPLGFSMDRAVKAALLAATDDAGIYAHPGEGRSTAQLALRIEELWCQDGPTDCGLRVAGELTTNDSLEPAELFTLSEQVRGDVDELMTVLQDQLLLELGGLELPAPVNQPVVPARFGWLERADGARFGGLVAERADGICVDGREATELAIEEITAVRIVEAPLMGGGEVFPVAGFRFDDDSVVVGRLLPESEGDRNLIATPDGVRLLRLDASTLTQATWTGGPPTCQVLARLDTRSGDGSRGSERDEFDLDLELSAPASRPRLILVDGRGDRIQPDKYFDDTVFAIPADRLGRGWKRHRLSWQDFEHAADSEQISARYQRWLQYNATMKQVHTGLLFGGVFGAVTSGILSGVMTGAYGNTGDPAFFAGGLVFGSGIGVCSVLAVVGAVKRVSHGKRADRPHKYYNLSEFLEPSEMAEGVEP